MEFQDVNQRTSHVCHDQWDRDLKRKTKECCSCRTCGRNLHTDGHPAVKTCCRSGVYSGQCSRHSAFPFRGLNSCCRKRSPKGSCGCQGVIYGQQKFLEFLWKNDESKERHRKTCKCCDICCKIRLSTGNVEHAPCPCTKSGHRHHMFCYATDQNVIVARVEAVRYQIRQTIKWLFINAALLGSFFNFDSIPEVIQWALVIICCLNICFYVVNLFKLKIAEMKVILETPSNKDRNCLWEKNLPRDVIRYFENASEDFFRRYWQRFSHLMSIMRTVMSSPLGRGELARGMDEELCTLGAMIEIRQQKEMAANRQLEDPKYRLPLLKHQSEAVSNPQQLAKYWRDYNRAVLDEQVRLSKPKDPFQPNAKRGSSIFTSSHVQAGAGFDFGKYEVPIASAIWCLEYQYSCEHDVHPSPAVSSASPSLRNFFDFMKIHHEKDHCSSLQWTANLKYWISVKMKEVVDQFDIANNLLRRLGVGNIQIGISATTDLQQAFSTHEELATFLPLLGFLTLTHNQSYLVWRYRFLVKSPCLQDYSWDSGGSARQWTQETGPCDSEIVLHFFCSYMDMKLPDLPFHLTRRRPFSDSFVVMSPEPHLTALKDIAIVRQWASPPHFNVIVKGKVFEMPGGSNNLFLSLSYLIYCIKLYRQGKVGRVDLGKLGLNMLWIVEDNNV